MKVTVERGALLKGLSRAAAVVEKKSTIPILANVLLEAEGEELKLTATDLEQSIELKVPAQIALPGAITVEAALLHSITRELADGAQVTLELDAEKERLALAAGRSRYKLQTRPAADFPPVQPAEDAVRFALPAAALRTMLAKVAFAQSTEDARYYLNGVHLEAQAGGLFLAATQGHLLASARIEAPEGSTEISSAIIPRDAVAQLQALLAEVEGELEVAVSQGKQIRVSFDETALTSKLIDGNFPDWRRVVPQSNPHTLKVNREAFAAGIRRASVVSNDKERRLQVALAGETMTLTTLSHEHGEGVEEVPVAWEGPELSLHFNAKYLLDTLAAIAAPDIEVRLADPSAPTLFQNPADDTAQWVVMPMR
jgi:DNA polymerase-3 subunit beta